MTGREKAIDSRMLLVTNLPHYKIMEVNDEVASYLKNKVNYSIKNNPKSQWINLKAQNFFETSIVSW